MNTLFLAPHNDDETLFGAFTLLRYRPHVIVCFTSALQDSPRYPGGPISSSTRYLETVAALTALGLDPSKESGYEQWPYPDNESLDVEAFETELRYVYELHQPEVVFAPVVEAGGHEQHNTIGRIALEVFGDRVRPYLTYTWPNGRSKGQEVEFEPHWPALKLRALSCYESQIQSPATGSWFIDAPIREYVP